MHNFLLKIIWRDRNKHGGGILTFVKNGLLPKHIPDLESNIIEILPLEIRIDKSKWIVLNIYRPPASNIQAFIDELSNTLDKSFSKYDSIIVMGDINIDTTEVEQAKLTNWLVLYDVIKNNVMQIRSYRSKRLKCYRRWHCLLLYQILWHSDQRFLRYKLLKVGDFYIYCMAKWPGVQKLYSNMASTI